MAHGVAAGGTSDAVSPGPLCAIPPGTPGVPLCDAAGATPHVTPGGRHSAASTGLPAAASSGAPWLASPECTAGALCAVPPATHCGAAPTGPRSPAAGESYCGPTRLDTLSCTVVRYVRHYAPRYVPDRVLHYAAYPARGRALRRAAPRLLNHALRPLWRPAVRHGGRSPSPHVIARMAATGASQPSRQQTHPLRRSALPRRGNSCRAAGTDTMEQT